MHNYWILAKEEVIVNESEQEKFVREMMEDFDRSDLDGNGSMDFSEYIRQVWSDETQEKSATLQQLRRQFKAHYIYLDSQLLASIISRPVVPGCAMAHPIFHRSVNPISTRGDRLCPPNYYWHTRIFRPSEGPVMTREKLTCWKLFSSSHFGLNSLLAYMYRKTS